MSNPARRWFLPALVGSLAAASPLPGQERARDEPPIIRSVGFTGVAALDERELRESIVTRETRCLSVLLRPVCWLTNWGVFFEEHVLEPEEVPRDELRLRILYFRRGYREARVSSEVLDANDRVDVRFHVQEGPPTLIADLVLRQEPEILGGTQIRRAALPEAGSPLDLIRLDSALARLNVMLQDEGYLDVEVRDTVTVAEAERLAWVEVTLDPGPLTRLAEFEVVGNQEIPDQVVEAATLLRPGRVLRRGELLAARRSLYESNLFHEATIAVPPGQGPAKVVRVEVREAPPRAPMLGVGVSTLEFVQADARFVHYNFLGGGRRLDLRATVANLLARRLTGRSIFRDVGTPGLPFEDRDAFLRPTWQLSAEFQQPSFRGAENRLGLAAFTHRLIVPGVAVDRGIGGNLSVTRRLPDRSPVSLTYLFELVAVEAGDLYFCVNFGLCDPGTIAALRTNHRLSPLGLSYSRDHTDDPISPTLGHRLRLDLEHASTATVSEFQYNRISGEGSYYRPVGPVRRPRVWAGRLRVGWAQPLQGTLGSLGLDADTVRALLHPRKRFYAGGSRSVRGYGENQLGPRVLTVDPSALTDPELENPCTPEEIVAGVCDPNIASPGAFLARPLGGSAVLEASLEYRVPLWREFGGVLFVDAGYVRGRAAGLGSPSVAAVTPGFGFRYDSPFGQVRADLGIRPQVRERLPVFTEFVDEAGERRIVALDRPLDWNPLQDRGGLRQILGRLQLHLAIGQAF